MWEEAELVMTIKEIRMQTGLSRKEFCERFSIPLRTMEEWEAGRRKPPEYIPRMLAYYVQILYKEQKKDNKIIIDPDGRKIVLVNEIRFCKFRFIGSSIPLATDQCFRS